MRRRLAVVGLILVTSACADAPPAPQELPRPTVTPRALRDITVARTPERIARGQYLTEGLLQCFVCHSERDWSQPGAPPIAALRGAGAIWPGKPWLVAPNLTPDRETGIGRWTDDMLMRAIREGVSHDGRALHSQMWSASFHALTDADVEAVVAYLRSLKPIRRPLPATTIPASETEQQLNLRPITAPVSLPGTADPVQRGRRLALLADCAGCHSSWHSPKNPGLFGGGNLIDRGDHRTWSSNLTTDPSGIPHYDEAFFRDVMRTGRAKGRELSPVMPWIVFQHLTDDDLNALFAFLRAIPPVKHVIDNIDAPTTCDICGGVHPLGQYNRAKPHTLAAVDAAALKGAAGRYRFEDGWIVELAFDRGRLWQVKGPGRRCELITEDRTTFFCETGVDRLQFVRDAAGTVTAVINMNTDRGERVK